MLHPYLGYYTLRSAHCRQIANFCSVRATGTAVQRFRLFQDAGRKLSYWKDGYTKDSTCSYRAVTGNSGKYISTSPSIFFVGEHCTHSRFVKPPAPVNIFFVCSAYLILSIVRLHPRTDSKIEIDRMQRFHCCTSCSPDSDSGGHALIAHQFPRIFHFTRKTSTKTTLTTHWTP